MGEVGCMFWCEDWKTLEEVGVDVEDFKMDVMKQRWATFGSHASGYAPNIGLSTSILD
jgi:hypothetical protein